MLIAAVFVASRLVYYAVGVRYIDGQIDAWQFLDRQLLEHDLLRSLFYLHSQPPAFNLLTGLVLKLTAQHSGAVLHALFLALGLVLYLSSFAVMRRLGVSPVIAFAVSTWFNLSPSVVLYENWFFYTLPLATLLTVSTLALLEFFARKTPASAAILCCSLALLCCVQSTFHPAYFALVLLAVILACPKERKRLLVAGAAPLAFLLLLCCKNALMFDTFGLSSWLGMSLGRVVLVQLPESDRQALVADGQMSPVALVEPFSDLEKYPAENVHPLGFDDVPALRQIHKSTGGPNLNHLAYIGISKQYLHDCVHAIRRYPVAYLKGVARSVYIYTKSSSDYAWLIDNRRRIALFDGLYNRVFYGEISLQAGLKHVRGQEGEAFHLYLLLAAGLPALLGFGLRVTLWQHPSLVLSREQRLTLGFICFTIGYVALVGVLLESGENNRFRFMTDPLSACLLALVLERYIGPKLRAHESATKG